MNSTLRVAESGKTTFYTTSYLSVLLSMVRVTDAVGRLLQLYSIVHPGFLAVFLSATHVFHRFTVLTGQHKKYFLSRNFRHSNGRLQ